MSVVCVKVSKGYIHFAADSIVVRGYTKQKDFTKLEKINGMIIGGVGYAEETNLLFMFARTHKPIEPTEKGLSDFIFEFYKWKNDLQKNFDSNNNYLIGVGGHCFYIENMFVKEVLTYQAIGAGMDYSLAALYLGKTAKDAVKVACELCCYVAEPIICEKMKVEV